MVLHYIFHIARSENRARTHSKGVLSISNSRLSSQSDASLPIIGHIEKKCVDGIRDNLEVQMPYNIFVFRLLSYSRMSMIALQFFNSKIIRVKFQKTVSLVQP